MAKLTLRDAGGGERRNRARLMTSALVLLLITTVAGCSLTSPTSSNNASDLTGQNPNTQFTFTGTVAIFISSGTLVGDDTSTIVVTAEVRDANGEPIPNLATVVFSASLGGFVDSGDPTLPVAQAVTSLTFSGFAQVRYRSASFGSATITASVGNVSASAEVEVEPPPERGAIQLVFEGGSTTESGGASVAAPFTRELNAIVTDPATGNLLPGVEVRFRIVLDGTLGSGVGGAKLLGLTTTFTDQFGGAVGELRVLGVGTVAIIAEMIDSNTGEVAGTSNQIIATTTASLIIQLTFSDGASITFTSGAPYTEGLIATVTDTSLAAVPGVTVRFRVTADSSTAGATLTPASSLALTNASGVATSSITVPDAGGGTSSVTVIAEVIDSSNNVLATSNTVVASGT